MPNGRSSWVPVRGLGHRARMKRWWGATDMSPSTVATPTPLGTRVTHTFEPAPGPPKANAQPWRHSWTPSAASHPRGQLPQLFPLALCMGKCHAHVLSTAWQAARQPATSALPAASRHPMPQDGCW